MRKKVPVHDIYWSKRPSKKALKNMCEVLGVDVIEPVKRPLHDDHMRYAAMTEAVEVLRRAGLHGWVHLNLESPDFV